MYVRVPLRQPRSRNTGSIFDATNRDISLGHKVVWTSCVRYARVQLYVSLFA